MPALIREIQIQDSAGYRQLRDKLDAESETWGADPGERYPTDYDAQAFVGNLLQDKFSKLLVAEDSRDLVGFISAIAGKWKRGKHYVDINIGILASHCGLGIGSQFFAEIEKWAIARGVRKFELFVREDNWGARRLYEKMGFEVEGVRKESLQVRGEYFNEVWMAKFLNG